MVEGSLDLELDGTKQALGPRGFAYIPQGTAHGISSGEKTRAVVIEKPYAAQSREQGAGSEEYADSLLPARRSSLVVVGSEDAVPATPLADDSSLAVKFLLPDEPAFDFAVNIMVYQPGASLSQVEMHIMEHGLMMLEGGGIYRLGDAWYPVTAGDFIWMGPWCPAMVRRDRQSPREIHHLQGHEPASAGRPRT